MNSNTDSSNWMFENLSLLGNQPLKNIVMPASHDAAMYEIGNCAYGASTCNTQTQVLSIIQQLQCGIRYFDLRPVIYNSTLYTGHYTSVAGQYLGCNGPELTNILTQISDFMQGSKDLVILKFSHYIDLDSKKGGFSDDQMKALCSLIVSHLQSSLYDDPGNSGSLSNVLLNQFIGSGGRVLAVFDQLENEIKQQFTGIHSYADFPGSADLVVYDSYSKTNDLAEMMQDQFSKMENPDYRGDNLFLLSWTLTQSPLQAMSCRLDNRVSILSLADHANSELLPGIQTEYDEGKINISTIPNLIYVDKVDSFALDVAMWLNLKLLSDK